MAVESNNTLIDSDIWVVGDEPLPSTLYEMKQRMEQQALELDSLRSELSKLRSDKDGGRKLGILSKIKLMFA
ncbi:hypothetical protein [Photobacterium damselae]|uniref:hypothetical protein n=1 Tax=Photobacterium damselae TaxID=38293 RepID=UPI0040676C4C